LQRNERASFIKVHNFAKKSDWNDQQKSEIRISNFIQLIYHDGTKAKRRPTRNIKIDRH
jgi:hypothetical protein